MWPVKVLSIAAAVFLFFFIKLVNLGPVVISVPIQYVIAPGYAISDQYPTRATLTLRGENGSIREIEEKDLRIVADLSANQTEGTYQTSLKVVKLGAVADISPLEITPEPGKVTVQIQRSSTKEVPVNIRLSGSPKAGTEVVSYQISPERVRITGPRSKVPSIESVETEEVDLGTHGEDFAQTVRLRSPDSLIRIINVDSVELRVGIREAMRIAQFQDVPIAIVGLSDNLVLSAEAVSKGSLKLQGLQNQLNAVDPTQLRMIIDGSSITAPGTYQAKLIPEVPSDLIVQSFEPKTIEITVSLPGAIPLPQPSPRTP